jgi:DNA-directed RNA polymerase specialized sigma24 family protein
MTNRDFTELENRIRVVLTEEAAALPPLDASVAAVRVPEDFDAFYGDARGRLYRALVLSLRDRDLATEAVDVGMARSFQRWRRVKAGGHAEAAAYAAAYRWAAKRAGRRGGTSGFRLQRAERSEESVAAEGAFAQLTLADRSVIVARRYLEWDDESIALGHGITPDVVKRRFDAAVAKVATILGVESAVADQRVATALRSEARDLIEPLGRAETVRGRAWLQRTGIAIGSAAAVLALVGGGAWAYRSLTGTEPAAEVVASSSSSDSGPERATSELVAAAAVGELDWAQVPLGIDEGEVSAVLTGPAGFVAFGQEWSGPGQAFALASEDGLTWEPLSIPLPQQAWVQGTSASSSDYLVSANAFDERNGRDGSLLLASEDGVNWQTYELPESPRFVGGMNVWTWTNVTSVERAADGSVAVMAFRGGDLENLDVLLRDVLPDDTSIQEFGWGTGPAGVDIYGENGTVETIPWSEFDLDQEVIDVLSGSMVLWTTDELGTEWTETKLSIPGAGRDSWVLGAARVEGGYVAVVNGRAGGGALWRLDDVAGEWSRVDLVGDGIVTAIAGFDEEVVVAGQSGGQPAMWTSTDGVNWDAAEVAGMPEGTIERLIASSGGIAALVSGNSFLAQQVSIETGDFTVEMSGAGIYTVIDADGNEVIEVFAEDAALVDGAYTIVDPETGETIVSFTQRDIESAWESVWREADFEGASGPDYQIALSEDAVTWSTIDVESITGGGFYPQTIAVNNGVVVVSGYQEEGGFFGNFEGPPSPTLWVATLP